MTLFDYRCGARAGESGADEQTRRHMVVLPRTGHFVWHRGREQLQGAPTHALFASAGSEYRVSHPCCGGDRCTVLEFTDELREELAVSARGVFLLPHVPTDGSTHLAHVRLLSGASAGTGPLDFAEQALLLLERLFALPAPAAPVPRSQRDLAAAAFTALAARQREAVRLEALAAQLGCSPWHLARVCRRILGTPLHRLLLQLRLRSALEPIMAGADLTALALELGFCDHAHFTRAFRREFGVPPSSLRGRSARKIVQAPRTGPRQPRRA